MTGRFGAFFIRQMTGEAPGSICNEGPGSEGEGSTLLEDVIKFVGSHRVRKEIVRIGPHGGRQLSVFYRHVYLGLPLGRGLMWGDTEIKNTMVQATQEFRQVRAARMRNTLRPVGWCVLLWM